MKRSPLTEAIMVRIRRVIVATDFDPASETALRYGRELARVFRAALDVLHVTRSFSLTTYGGCEYAAFPPGMQQEVEEAAARRTATLLTDEDRRDLHARAVTVTADDVAAAIIAHANDSRADLIVVGTHGRGPVAHLFLGSVAERLVRLAPCPVLTVHNPQHEFVMPEARLAVARA